MKEKGIPGIEIYPLLTIYSVYKGRQIAFLSRKYWFSIKSILATEQKPLFDFRDCPKAAVSNTQTKTANSY